MDYVLPSEVLEHANYPRTKAKSLMIFLSATSSEPDTTVSPARILTSLLLNIAKETAIRNLRTVYISRDPVTKVPWVHLHGTSQMDAAYWDNIHFVELPTEASFVHWFSRVHLSKRFADLVIVDGLDRLFLPERMRASDVLRLTSLLEDTRNFIDTSTSPEDHGHGCRLLVTSSLPVQSPSEFGTTLIPIHSLDETLLFSEESKHQYSLFSHNNRWKLDLQHLEDELFWKTFHPQYNLVHSGT